MSLSNRRGHVVKELDNALGCLIWIVVGSLLVFIVYHGGELADAVVRAIK